MMEKRAKATIQPTFPAYDVFVTTFSTVSGLKMVSICRSITVS